MVVFFMGTEDNAQGSFDPTSATVPDQYGCGQLQTNVSAGDAFADNMARASAARGLSLQYCMALPRFFLQASRYGNLTTIRVSDDRFGPGRWDAFLYNSQLASAIGVWPWADVFRSTETNNLLLATLSGGMVGIGDALDHENKLNLLRAARPDGVLVKPDAPIVPVDAMYLKDLNGPILPMVAWTFSDHGPLRTAYVFVYNRHSGHAATGFTPASFGFQGPVYAVEPRTGAARRLSADEIFGFMLDGHDTVYYLLAPIGRSGIAFFGDEGKFVTNGRKRIAAIDDQPGQVTVTVTFAADEKAVRLFGYADRAPAAKAHKGSVGPVSFDAATKRFSAEVSPGAAVTRELPGDDPVQTAIVEFQSASKGASR